MYDNQAAVGLSKAAELPSIHQALQENNASHRSIIGEIEAKLHHILDRRKPQDPTNAAVPPESNDAAGAIRLEINFMRYNRDRLSAILDHLNEII